MKHYEALRRWHMKSSGILYYARVLHRLSSFYINSKSHNDFQEESSSKKNSLHKPSSKNFVSIFFISLDSID
ncbi:hypothetical protein K450DRAFT_225525 [Umbelopsis ramanniana AG]|uniref:Uncharacterized protein n=1 Tax=Umbelopsis ramanniana AG TaxID=1314678 RepID=A0AAD5HFX9_UMBRA|nr:uncharacterized protein K450DRAFT_225525 [Umbelopsis ramanniana AG]KAI8582932.1 hypothetical protein K450DRAFT_225525 [Umbelopsis ramanniana AG]